MTPEAGGTGAGDGARETLPADDVRVALEPSAAEPVGHWGNALQALGRQQAALAGYRR